MPRMSGPGEAAEKEDIDDLALVSRSSPDVVAGAVVSTGGDSHGGTAPAPGGAGEGSSPARGSVIGRYTAA